MDSDKNPVGAPTKFEDRFCTEIEEHMANGYSIESFAGKIGVSEDTVYEWRNAKNPDGSLKHPEFSESVKRGKAKSIWFWELFARNVSTGQIQNANAAMVIFQLKNRLGWKDRTDVTSDDTKLKEAASLEEIAKLLQDSYKDDLSRNQNPDQGDSTKPV